MVTVTARDIDYVIVSFPRSGTGYIAKVLDGIGLNCGHEKAFSHNRQIMQRETDEIWGDSSWLAVPYIDALPETTKVYWQTRHPVKSLDSAFPRKGSLVGTSRAKCPYSRFVRRHCPNLPDASEEERLLA